LKTIKSIVLCIVVVLFKNGGIYFGFCCHGDHIYQYIWKLTAGEKLHAEQEFDNPKDKFDKVIKTNEMVGHLPPKYLQIFSLPWWKEMYLLWFKFSFGATFLKLVQFLFSFVMYSLP